MTTLLKKLESMFKMQECSHDSGAHCMEEDCYIHEDGGYNQGVKACISTLPKILEEHKKFIIEFVKDNHKGTFVDEGGNNCWYTEDLVKALTLLTNKDE